MRKNGYVCAVAVLVGGLVIPAGPAVAEPTEVRHTQAVGGLFNTCSEELVQFTGKATVLDKQIADGSVKTNFIIHGTGIGSSGTQYIVHQNLLLVRATSGVPVSGGRRHTAPNLSEWMRERDTPTATSARSTSFIRASGPQM